VPSRQGLCGRVRDDFAGGGRDGGGELLEQACREVRWALAAAEDDDARGHVSIPVNGAVIEGCDQTDEKNRRGRAAAAMNELVRTGRLAGDCSKRLMGLEPTTFCMASSAAVMSNRDEHPANRGFSIKEAPRHIGRKLREFS